MINPLTAPRTGSLATAVIHTSAVVPAPDAEHDPRVPSELMMPGSNHHT